MKVLMTTDNIGGVWTYALGLAKSMKKHGIEVYLAITGFPPDSNQRKELNGINWYFSEYKQEWMDDPWNDIDLAGEWLMELQETIQPDLIHLNSYSFGNLPWKVPVVMTFHSCILSWWEAVKKEPAPEKYNLYGKRAGDGLKAASLVIAPSRTMLSEAEKYYGPFRNKQMIYNGLNKYSFCSSKKEKILFSMGRLWDQAKNIRLILEAAEDINYPIYIAGDNSSLKNKNLPSNIHLTGFLSKSEVREYLSKASVYLLPVLYEPFGYTFLEAAYSRCALVGGNIPSQREIWGNSMIYADPEDPEKLAKTVNPLMENEKELMNHAEMAFQHAYEHYSDDLMASHYADLYKQISKKEKKLYSFENKMS